MIDKKAIQEHIRGLLIALGEDPKREGLLETPERVAKMYEEIFEGIQYSNEDLVKMFRKTFEGDGKTTSEEMVIVRDIEIFSVCEHHLALMYDMKVTVAYLPNKKLLGLSKVARICDMVGKRLQLQERMGRDIAEIIQKVTDSQDVAVFIQGKHSCMSMRGIKKQQSITETSCFLGKFKENLLLQNRVYPRS